MRKFRIWRQIEKQTTRQKLAAKPRANGKQSLPTASDTKQLAGEVER